MSAASELAYTPIAELARRIERKEISPVEITGAMLDRIDTLNPRLNAYYTIFRDEVMAAARGAEAEIRDGAYRGHSTAFRSASRISTNTGAPRAARKRWRTTLRKPNRVLSPS